MISIEFNLYYIPFKTTLEPNPHSGYPIVTCQCEPGRPFEGYLAARLS